MIAPRTVQLTKYDAPESPVFTAQGPVPNRDWCEREADRLKQSGKPAIVKPNRVGRVAVFVVGG